jgi:hypothetical protein
MVTVTPDGGSSGVTPAARAPGAPIVRMSAIVSSVMVQALIRFNLLAPL